MLKHSLFPVIGFSMFLMSCSSLNAHYTCPIHLGVGCESLSSVNKRVDAGTLFPSKLKRPLTVISLKPEMRQQSTRHEFDKTPFAPKRVPAIVLRVWIAPFSDTTGNYHTSQMIYTVIEEAKWRQGELHE